MRSLKILIFATAVALILPAIAAANPGGLDPTYGVGGIATNIFGSADSWTYAVAVQSDGKAIIAGGKGGVGSSLERHNPDGSIDTSFGVNGVASADFGAGGFEDVAISPSGKIVAVGITGSTPYDWTVAMFNSNGTPDTSFSGDGKLTLDFAGNYDIPQSVQFRSDGGIVVVGGATVSGDYHVAVAEWNADGLPTNSFSGDGRTTVSFGGFDDFGVGVHWLSDGSLVLAATDSTAANAKRIVIFRLLATGLPDSTFGTGGYTPVLVSLKSAAAKLLALPDGKYLVTGEADGSTMGSDGLLAARFNADGKLDASYGTGGHTMVPVESVSGQSATLQLDGKLVMGGEHPTGPNFASTLTRLNADGTLDTTFGASGLVDLSFPPGIDDEVYGLATQPDGKLLVAMDSSSSPSGVALVRILDKNPPPVPLAAKFSKPTKSKLRAKKFKSFAGTAVGDGLTRVEVAIGRVDSKLLKKSKKCRFVTGTSGKTKKFKAVKKKCTPSKWLKASGAATWSYKFKKKLKAGKYKLYARAVGTGSAVSKSVSKSITLK